MEKAVGHSGRHGICSLLDREAHIRTNSRQEPPCFQQAARSDLSRVASEGVSVSYRRVSHSLHARHPLEHLEERGNVAVLVAKRPRHGEELVGGRGGRQRDAQLPCSVEREH